MTAPAFEVRHTVPCAEVEPLLRAARAEVAMLTLQLRSALHEAAELEQALAEEEPSEAPDALRADLDELVQARRRELDRELDDARAEAARLVEAARAEAAAVVARVAEQQREAARRSREQGSAPTRLGAGGRDDEDSEPAPDVADAEPDAGGAANGTPPPRRLQVVADKADEADDHPDADRADSVPPAADSVPPADAPTSVAVSPAAGAPTADPVPPADDAPTSVAMPPVAAVPPETPAPATPDALGPAATPDLVSQIVQGAVAAAVAQVVSTMQGGGMSGPALQPVTVRPPAVGPRQPIWRAALHLDVVLPLFAVLIVFVVLLAWVG